jgi:hypothetical protein
LVDPGKEAFEMVRRTFLKSFTGVQGVVFQKNPLAAGDNKFIDKYRGFGYIDT